MSVVTEDRRDVEGGSCAIRGYLYGEVNPTLGVLDPAGAATVYAVPARREGEAGRVTAEQLDEALGNAGRAVLRASVDARGAFCFTAQHDQDELDVFAVIDRVPLPAHKIGELPLPIPQAFYLGRQRPARSEEGAYLNLRIVHEFWCWLKKLADAWTITGRVVACSDGETPIGGVTVSAFDVDIVQTDGLGAAVSSPTGFYRIDYPGSSYRKGTWTDIELVAGPDLFFRIAAADGTVLLDENRSAGRASGRENSGPCAEVDLCVDVRIPDRGTPIPTAWVGVGNAFLLGDYDADGYATATKWAMTGSITMRGSSPPRTLAGNPVEYRFRVSDTTAPNSDPALGEPNFTRIVGVGANAGLFVNTHVGTMVRSSPFKQVGVTATLDDLDAEGWLDVNKSIQRAFVDDPDVDPVDLPSFGWVDEDALMIVNTGGLTTAPDVPAAIVTGQPVPAANHIPVEKKAFRFEIREVVDKPNGIFNTLAGSGRTLNAMIVNNNAVFARITMQEHQATTLCTPLSGQVHAAYTLHHPHLLSANLRVWSNNGSYDQQLVDAPLPFSGNTNPAVTSSEDVGVLVPGALHRCTYFAQLSVVTRLHNGVNGGVNQTHPLTSFFYEP